MGGLKGNIVVYTALILFAGTCVWAELSYKISDTLDPVTALYVALALSFAAGFVAGLAALHMLARLRIDGRPGAEARHA